MYPMPLNERVAPSLKTGARYPAYVDPATGNKILRYSKFNKVAGLCGIVVFGAADAIPIFAWSQLTIEEAVTYLLFFTGFVLLSAYAVLQYVRVKVILTSDGLDKTDIWGHVKSVKWAQISSVQNGFNKFIFYRATGEVLMSVNFEMVGMRDLVEMFRLKFEPATYASIQMIMNNAVFYSDPRKLPHPISEDEKSSDSNCGKTLLVRIGRKPD